jgi:CheY-like chemotaxis protein
VEDTGVGIAARDLPRLFVEFQQLEVGAAKPHQGTGLGLALVKRIVEAQGGSVSVRSVPGEGSTFSAIVPRRTTPVDVRDASSVATARGNQAVLVVDDDPATLKLAAVALRELGHRPVCRGNGLDALLAAAADPPAMVIVDLLMPPMDGFEFIARLRALQGQSDVPILVWTMKDLTDSERRELKTSAAAIVPKSAGGLHALVEELRRLLPPASMTAAE